VVGIDPGEKICGIAVLDSGQIAYAGNVECDQVFAKIQRFLIFPSVTVVVEAIRPYSLRLTPNVINTCLWIGEALFRLKCVLNDGQIIYTPRSEVRKWIFDSYPAIVLPLVESKILAGLKSGKYALKDGGIRKPSWAFVDDGIVKKIMKFIYQIPDDQKRNRFGLSEHSWQALSLASWFIGKEINSIMD